jgi:hypothetical protein
MASTVVSQAKVAVVDSVKVGRSAVYSRYNNGPRTILGMPALTGDEEVSAMQIRFWDKEIIQRERPS